MKSVRRAAHSFIFLAVSFLLSALMHIAALIWLSSITFEFVRLRSLNREAGKVFLLNDIKKVVIERPQITRGPGDGRGGVRGREEGTDTRASNPALLAPGKEADGSIAGSDSATIEHRQRPDEERWQPRQEIIAISGKLLGKDIVKGNRRIIPEIARTQHAPDITFPVAYDTLKRQPPASPPGGASDGPAGSASQPLAPLNRPGTGLEVPVSEVQAATAKIDRDEREERDIRPLDNFLRAELQVYSPFFDSGNSYFKLEVRRIGEEILPVLPKDIVFVQDSSASMAEQRLHFCREGLASSLAFLSKGDRFNIIAFSDNPVACFDGWAEPEGQALERGRMYASSLRSAGSTDILTSLKALRELDVGQGRPCIAFVVTDGLPTTGIVETASIISEFTKANESGISVFTMGTRNDANMYLLDILSYCNGGSTHVVKGGRWSIADDMTNLVSSISRPVLSNLKVAFAGSDIEVFPAKVRHLYMDDPLVLYGRFSKKMERITFQAIGAAADRRCDMIFDLKIASDAKSGAKEIRESWAMQKAYHLIGELARTGNESCREELRQLAKQYDLKIPYADEL